MKLFDEGYCAEICLKNKNEYVRLAAEDLRQDFCRVGAMTAPDVVDEFRGYRGCCIVIEDNSRPDIDPIEDESFSVVCDGEKIVISAPTYLGTMWGIYTFSKRVLGISPTYYWDGTEACGMTELCVEPFEINESPRGFGFRGLFINDEDLLTGMVESGGRREIDYPWYTDTVAPSVMDKVVETALRLKLNLVIPASFLDIDNPPEKALADCVAKRGIYLSQHHIEPVGVSTFTFDKYCEKTGKKGEFSYIKNPALMEEIWQYYAEKWAEYPNLIWQLGLRGKIDRPVWEEEVPTKDELRRYAEFISGAVGRQKEIVDRATCGRAKHYTCTLWMEGASLAKQGFLTHPEGVVSVFADNGPNQMYANDFYEVQRESGRRYGIYYHLQYFGLGPHLSPLTGVDKLHYNLKLAFDKGDCAYIILNSSNIREFSFELGAYSHMTWDMESFSRDGYLESYASQFGAVSEDVKNAVKSYYDAIAVLDTLLLKHHHANYFDFRYEDVEGIKNLPIKDGMTVNVCRHIIDCMDKDRFSPLWTEYYLAITGHSPKFEEVRDLFEKIAAKLQGCGQCGAPTLWAVYASNMAGLYGCMARLYEAKKARDGGKADESVALMRSAADSVKSMIEYRKRTQVGDFENWYRGDTKLDIPRLLREIERKIDLIK